MVTVECKTQDEADAAAARGDVIVWRAGHLVARDSARVYARDSASVYASDSARVYARDSASVYASDSACVDARDSARVYARDSACVDARDSARVYARDSACVDARDSARVDARDSASVDARDSARVYDTNTGSPLRRARPRLILGPLGSRNDTLGVSLPSDGSEPIVYAGCWDGRLSDFAARVYDVYPSGRYRDEYRAAIAMIHAIAAIPQEGQ